MTRPIFGDALDAASPGTSNYRSPSLADAQDDFKFTSVGSSGLHKALALAAVVALLAGMIWITVFA